MAVAQPGTETAVAEDCTCWSAPLRKEGASFTGITVIVNVCGDEVSFPPPVVPPLSFSVMVATADPLALGASVYVSVPLDATCGCAVNSAALSLATRKVTDCVD